NAATDFFAVATYSSNHGVQLSAPFLRDRALLRRALSTLKPAQRDPLGVTLSAASIDQEDFASMLEGEMADAIRGGLANQEMLGEQAKRRIEYQLDNLGEVAARLGAMEGQKHVVFFTEGFQSTRITDIKAAGRPPRIDG